MIWPIFCLTVWRSSLRATDTDTITAGTPGTETALTHFFFFLHFSRAWQLHLKQDKSCELLQGEASERSDEEERDCRGELPGQEREPGRPAGPHLHCPLLLWLRVSEQEEALHVCGALRDVLCQTWEGVPGAPGPSPWPGPPHWTTLPGERCTRCLLDVYKSFTRCLQGVY